MPNWINVKERLPSVSGRVLACVQLKTVRYIAILMYSIYDGKFHEGSTSGMGKVMEGITHWMELPKPPKEES